MDSDAESPSTNSPPSDALQTISPTERIKELSAIDQDISKVLRSASLAIRTLTATPPTSDPPSTGNNGDSALEQRKRLFEAHTRDFYTLIQSISAHLHRQTYALEEANIIAAEPASAAEPQVAPQVPKSVQQLASRPAGALNAGAHVKSEQPMQVTNGGLGNLDVGWLNSRRDVVGKQKEAELWRDARKLLEKMEQEGGEDSMDTT